MINQIKGNKNTLLPLSWQIRVKNYRKKAETLLESQLLVSKSITLLPSHSYYVLAYTLM
ncbi:hypothetical protein MACH08_32390 [Oceanobacillus kimchii]|uniref:HEPN domain-containing protein n=1 Tax=Oceanobacillus kimchii TaxID=746691 RepID=A0ABQ5TN16_9BACI|nr:hypothetical protein MACH08_32390 [Oceanobacillus kimchii]